jgi:hypothetical protein
MSRSRQTCSGLAHVQPNPVQRRALAWVAARGDTRDASDAARSRIETLTHGARSARTRASLVLALIERDVPRARMIESSGSMHRAWMHAS